MTRSEAIATYAFIRQDLAAGLNYGISVDLANACLEAVNSDFEFSERPSGQEFAEKFYAEYVKDTNI